MSSIVYHELWKKFQLKAKQLIKIFLTTGGISSFTDLSFYYKTNENE